VIASDSTAAAAPWTPDVRLIAFYLPQFHPVPENDAWWGKGFTEWTNVTRATPRFPGHYQPHLPADLGFYDLRLPEAREAQADLARQHGVHGFCYHHYWFGGRRILERPFDEVLRSGHPDFPFCLCWANENWTRAWDGGTSQVLLEQDHRADDDVAFMRSLVPAFADRRYIRVDGKPLFLVWRTKLLPDARRSAERWRETALREGVGELYLVRVESHADTTDPRTLGFDAATEFAPQVHPVHPLFDGTLWNAVPRWIVPAGYRDNRVLRYGDVMKVALRTPRPDYECFKSVAPGWDNSPRRARAGTIVVESTPAAYRQWLEQALAVTRERFRGDHRLLFINAWNEWAEGAHLEPDQRWGRQYLEATRDALHADPGNAPAVPQPTNRKAAAAPAPIATRPPGPLSRWYWEKRYELRQARASLDYLRATRGSRFR